MKPRHNLLSSFYPEVEISGYTSVDGTIEFYNRVNSILDSSMHVLDYGAGRAAWYEDDICAFRKRTRTLKGKVKNLVGCDIDGAILDNNSVDEQIKIDDEKSLPFKDCSFDMIISDYTFEHITSPDVTAKELHRVLKKGGWICARTPNKYSYISIITRIIKNKFHARILKHAQPDRKGTDVFPTSFKLNSMRKISKNFAKEYFDNYTYRYEAEPAYHFNSKLIFTIFLFINKISPSFLKGNLFIFLRKK